MTALMTSLATRPGAAPSLRMLVGRATLLSVLVLGPLWIVCASMGRHDIARGFTVGLLLGVLNSLLLAQRLDRMISGVEGVERLKQVFGTNRALRFTLVLGGAAVATQVRGLHVLALVAGLGFFFAVSVVIYARGVLQMWRSEEGRTA